MRPVKTFVLELDRPRKLALDFNALKYLDDAGINVLEGLDFNEFSRPGKLLTLFTAMLQSDAKRAGETLTEDQVGELLDFGAMAELAATLEAIVEGSVPTPKEGAGANPPAAAEPSPGSSSGPSAATTSDSPTTSSAS